MHRNYWACPLEARSCTYSVQMLQLLQPQHPLTHAPQWEATAIRRPWTTVSSLHSVKPEKSPCSNEDPTKPKIKWLNKKKKKNPLTKVSTEGNISQHNKSYFWQSVSQYKVQRWKPESIPTKIWKKARMPALTTSTQHSIGSPSLSNQTKERKKRYANWKGRGKAVTICIWHGTIYRKP